MEKKKREWTPLLQAYDEVKTFLSHDGVEAVSPENSKIFEWIKVHAPRFAQSMGHVIFLRNGEDHRRLRLIYQRILSQTNIRRVTKNFQARVQDVLRDIPDKSQFDFVDDFSRPVVLGFILDLIGLEARWIAPLSPLIHLTAAGFDFLHPPEKWKKIEEAFSALEQIIQERVLQARLQKEDPIYDFLTSDAWQSDTEKTDNLLFLIGAAYETTNSALAGSLVQLAQEPQYWAQLQDMQQAPRIVEECLRLVSPVKTVVRMPTQDVSLGAQVFPAGRMVQASLREANTGPVQGGKSNIHVNNDTKHLAFGYGAHYCVGAPLARIELQTCLTYLSTQFHPPIIRDTQYSETAYTRSILHAYGTLDPR
jgi:cytochrome P450